MQVDCRKSEETGRVATTLYPRGPLLLSRAIEVPVLVPEYRSTVVPEFARPNECLAVSRLPSGAPTCTRITRVNAETTDDE